MASSKIEKRFAVLEERVATLETIIETAMADADADETSGTAVPAAETSADGGAPDDEPTKP